MSPIVTTTPQEPMNSSQALLIGGDDDSSVLPWLFSNAPKRKKQAISPNESDFSLLVPTKPKTTKKDKTLSRVKVDKDRNKYAEIVIPPPNKDIDQIQEPDYVINRVELGKQTHDSALGDVQTTLDTLVSRYDDDKIKKDKLKAQVEKLATVIIKVTQSSKVIEPATSSLMDEQVVK